MPSYLLSLSLLFVISSSSVMAQGTSSENLTKATEWLEASDIDLAEASDNFCDLIAGKDIPLGTLMDNNSSYMKEATSSSIETLVDQYQGSFSKKVIDEGIRNQILLQVTQECTAFKDLVKDQLVKKIHSLYKLSAAQASLVDEIGAATCSCTDSAEDCLRSQIKSEQTRARSLFPEKDGIASEDQLYNIIMRWKSVGCDQ